MVLNSGKDSAEDDTQTGRKQFRTSIVLKVAKGLAFAIALIILLLIHTVVFRWLWNMTIPDLFNLKVITFWQSFSLLLLVLMLGMILNWGVSAHP